MKKFLSSALLLVFSLQFFYTPNAFATAVTDNRANDADDLVNGAAFNNLGAFTLTVADNDSFTTGVVTTAGNGGANAGTLTFAGTSTLNTALSTNVAGAPGAALLAINGGVVGEAVGFGGVVHATTLNVTGTGTVNTRGFGSSSFSTGVVNFAGDGAFTLSAGSSLYGSITTAAPGTGSITMNGNLITGTIGTNANYTSTITLQGAVGTTNTFRSNVFAGNLTGTTANTLDIGANTIDLNGGAGNFIYNVAGMALRTKINSTTSFGNIDATAGSTLFATTAILDVDVAGVIANGDTFLIVNSAAGNSVVPATITDNSALVSFTGSNPAIGDLRLTAAVNATGVATSPAASTLFSSVTETLRSTASGSDFNNAIGRLYGIADSSATNTAIESLDPTNNGANTQASFDITNEAIGALNNHLSEVNGGPAGTGVSTGDVWTDNGWWAKGFGSSADQDSRKGVNGYDSTLWGVTGGLDGLVNPETRLGFAGGYANTGVDNKGEGGGTDVDSYLGTIYLRYDDASPWYANGGFNFAWNEYDSTRNIEFVGRTAQGGYDGQTYTGFIDAGYVVKQNEWEITPMASFTYSHLELDSYTETGAGDLNLSVASQDYDLAQSGLGVQFAYPIVNENGKWVPEAHVKWLYDFVGDKAASNAAFTGGGSSFGTNGLDPAQNTLNVGAGLTFYSKGNISITGVYDLELKEDYMSHTGQGVFRYTY